LHSPGWQPPAGVGRVVGGPSRTPPQAAQGFRPGLCKAPSGLPAPSQQPAHAGYLPFILHPSFFIPAKRRTSAGAGGGWGKVRGTGVRTCRGTWPGEGGTLSRGRASGGLAPGLQSSLGVGSRGGGSPWGKACRRGPAPTRDSLGEGSSRTKLSKAVTVPIGGAAVRAGAQPAGWN
jgi:hypothetical protein